MAHEIRWLCKSGETVSSHDVSCEVYLQIMKRVHTV